ncbi:MAG TPA: DUF4412 domain-containing protein [Candidatus Saccharimonadales bacterium]|nr:DUF4412 domain-containing protein [Candidatus Saccharimonadales bacterium]
MKKLYMTFALGAAILAWGFEGSAQMMNPGQTAGLNAAMLKLFGELNAFSSKATLRMLDKNQKQTMVMPISFALLDGKVRMDMDLNQLKSAEMQAEALTMLKQLGMDKMTSVIRPDKKSTLLIAPLLQGYAEMPLSKQEADAANKKYQSTSTKLGKEVIDGHPCEKNKVVVVADDGKKQEAIVWNATDLKDFPIQMQTVQGEGAIVMNFRELQFAKPDAKLFDAPANYTKYASADKMMEGAMMKMMQKK